MIELINGFSAFFSILCAIFFGMGALGYSDDNDMVKRDSWFHVESSSLTVYANLLKMIFIASDGTVEGMYYDDDMCLFDFCDYCKLYGTVVMPLMVLSTITAFALFVTTFIGAHYPTVALSWRGIFLSSLSTISALLGWGFFMNKCYLEFHKVFKEGSGYGPGSVLPLLGYLIMFGVTVMQIIATVLGTRAEARRKAMVFVEPDAEEEDA